jgi:hypothetical protein
MHMWPHWYRLKIIIGSIDVIQENLLIKTNKPVETHWLTHSRNHEFQNPVGRKLFYNDDRSYAPNKLKLNAMTDVNYYLKGEWFRMPAGWQNY